MDDVCSSNALISDSTMLQSNAKPLSTSIVPTKDSPFENDPEIFIDSEDNTNNLINALISVASSDDNKYQLPYWSNRGKLLERYSLDNSKFVKYPISHCVSIEHLPCALQNFVNQMSIITIPTSIRSTE